MRIYYQSWENRNANLSCCYRSTLKPLVFKRTYLLSYSKCWVVVYHTKKWPIIVVSGFWWLWHALNTLHINSWEITTLIINNTHDGICTLHIECPTQWPTCSPTTITLLLHRSPSTATSSSQTSSSCYRYTRPPRGSNAWRICR